MKKGKGAGAGEERRQKWDKRRDESRNAWPAFAVVAVTHCPPVHNGNLSTGACCVDPGELLTKLCPQTTCVRAPLPCNFAHKRLRVGVRARARYCLQTDIKKEPAKGEKERVEEIRREKGDWVASGVGGRVPKAREREWEKQRRNRATVEGGNHARMVGFAWG